MFGINRQGPIQQGVPHGRSIRLGLFVAAAMTLLLQLVPLDPIDRLRPAAATAGITVLAVMWSRVYVTVDSAAVSLRLLDLKGTVVEIPRHEIVSIGVAKTKLIRAPVITTTTGERHTVLALSGGAWARILTGDQTEQLTTQLAAAATPMPWPTAAADPHPLHLGSDTRYIPTARALSSRRSGGTSSWSPCSSCPRDQREAR